MISAPVQWHGPAPPTSASSSSSSPCSSMSVPLSWLPPASCRPADCAPCRLSSAAVPAVVAGVAATTLVGVCSLLPPLPRDDSAGVPSRSASPRMLSGVPPCGSASASAEPGRPCFAARPPGAGSSWPVFGSMAYSAAPAELDRCCLPRRRLRRAASQASVAARLGGGLAGTYTSSWRCWRGCPGAGGRPRSSPGSSTWCACCSCRCWMAHGATAAWKSGSCSTADVGILHSMEDRGKLVNGVLCC